MVETLYLSLCFLFCLFSVFSVCSVVVVFSLADAGLEADDAAAARHQSPRDLPTQHERAGFIRLRRENRRSIRLRAAGNVLQARRQAIGDGHVGDRLTAVIAVFEQERHHVADLRRLSIGALD